MQEVEQTEFQDMATTMRLLKDLGTHAREIKIEAAQSEIVTP